MHSWVSVTWQKYYRIQHTVLYWVPILCCIRWALWYLSIIKSTCQQHKYYHAYGIIVGTRYVTITYSTIPCVHIPYKLRYRHLHYCFMHPSHRYEMSESIANCTSVTALINFEMIWNRELSCIRETEEYLNYSLIVARRNQEVYKLARCKVRHGHTHIYMWVCLRLQHI